MSFHEDCFHQKDKVSDREAEIWWEKYMHKDPSVLVASARSAHVYEEGADEWFEIETVHWQDLDSSVRQKLLMYWNKLLRNGLRDL